MNGGNRLQSNNNYGQYGIQGSYSGSNSYSQSLENSKLQYTGGSTNNNYYYDVKDNYYWYMVMSDHKLFMKYEYIMKFGLMSNYS